MFWKRVPSHESEKQIPQIPHLTSDVLLSYTRCFVAAMPSIPFLTRVTKAYIHIVYFHPLVSNPQKDGSIVTCYWKSVQEPWTGNRLDGSQNARKEGSRRGMFAIHEANHVFSVPLVPRADCTVSEAERVRSMLCCYLCLCIRQRYHGKGFLGLVRSDDSRYVSRLMC